MPNEWKWRLIHVVAKHTVLSPHQLPKLIMKRKKGRRSWREERGWPLSVLENWRCRRGRRLHSWPPAAPCTWLCVVAPVRRFQRGNDKAQGDTVVGKGREQIEKAQCHLFAPRLAEVGEEDVQQPIFHEFSPVLVLGRQVLEGPQTFVLHLVKMVSSCAAPGTAPPFVLYLEDLKGGVEEEAEQAETLLLHDLVAHLLLLGDNGEGAGGLVLDAQILRLFGRVGLFCGLRGVDDNGILDFDQRLSSALLDKLLSVLLQGQQRLDGSNGGKHGMCVGRGKAAHQPREYATLTNLALRDCGYQSEYGHFTSAPKEGAMEYLILHGD